MSQVDESDPRLVTSLDGTHIAYWTAGSGPPLLLVHGAMSDHHRWRITEHLTHRRQVSALDRRGRGASGDTRDWSLDREVEDVVAVIDALAADAGMPVDVLGHSLGGYLTLRAAGHTSNVRRLVVYEPAINEDAQPADVVARMQAAADAGRYEDVTTLMMREVVRMPEEQIAVLRAQPSWAARVAAAPTVPREVGTPLILDPQEAAAVSVPTLLILGGDSPTFVKEGIRTAAAAVPSARVVTLAGHQHVADQMDPEMFAGVVLDFLDA